MKIFNPNYLLLLLLLLIGCNTPTNEDDPCSEYFDCSSLSSSQQNSSSTPNFQTLFKCGDWPGILQKVKAYLEQENIDTLIQSELMMHQGEILWKQGRDHEAEEVLRKALELTKQKTWEVIGDIYYNLGEIYYIRHFVKGQPNIEEAKTFHYKALKFRGEIGDSSGLSHSMSRIGVIHERERNIDSALYYYHAAIEVCEAINYPVGKTRPYTHLGVYRRSQGDTLGAISEYKKALDINKRYFNHEALPFNLVNISGLQNGPNAEQDMLCALSISRKTEFKLAIVNTLFSLGMLATINGQQETAQNYFQQTLEEAEKWDYTIYSSIASRQLNSSGN